MVSIPPRLLDILWDGEFRSYHRELRDYLIGPRGQHDGTLERWIEIFGPAG